MIDVVREIEAAEARIRPYIRETPLEPALALSQDSGVDVHLKCENLQHTGSFKARGALSKVLSLSKAEIARGVITASTGNHGAAVAWALKTVGARATVYVPEGTSATKLAAIERYGSSIRRHGEDSGATEVFARKEAGRAGGAYISPYNDMQVVGGQGTIGIELLRRLDRIDAVFVSVGGGGLIAGVAAALKSARPGIRVIGCSPENSQVMVQSVKAGRILDLPSTPTLSDGTAGGVEDGSITFPLVTRLVDEFVTVSEAEIAAGMRRVMEAHHMMIEGAAGVAIAGFVRQKAAWANKRVVVVVCGANIGLPSLKAVLT